MVLPDFKLDWVIQKEMKIAEKAGRIEADRLSKIPKPKMSKKELL